MRVCRGFDSWYTTAQNKGLEVSPVMEGDFEVALRSLPFNKENGSRSVV